MRAAGSFAPTPNGWMPNVVQGLTAAGNSQGTATAIPANQDCSIFVNVAASTGCVLPASGVSPGEQFTIGNHGANALSVYPASGGQIGRLGTNTAFSLASGSGITFMYLGAGAWCSGV